MSQIWRDSVAKNSSDRVKRKMHRAKRNAGGGKCKPVFIGVVAKCPPICRIIPVADRSAALFLLNPDST